MNNKNKYPTDAILAVNNYCNCKCIFCNIWQLSSKRRENIPLDVYKKLPSSLKTINLTGGEPFLSNDLEKIFQILREKCPSSTITFSSNGLLTKKICSSVEKLLKIDTSFRIAFSLDGLEEMHDKIRGIPKAFAKLNETLSNLASIGYSGTRLGMTITPQNISALPDVYNFAEKLGLELGFWLALDSEFYFKIGKIKSPDIEVFRQHVEYVIKEELKGFRLKRWLRAFFAKGLIEHLDHKNTMKCSAAFDSFFIDATGSLYPCIVMPEEVGNLKEKTFEDIWYSPRMERVRFKVANCSKDCRMICTARAYMKKNSYKVIWWVIKSKTTGKVYP